MKKLANIVINALLILIPFLPITENFFPNQIDHSTFGSYILTCIGIATMMIMLIIFVRKNNLSTGILLCLLGILVMFPLHLGPPRENETIFEASSIEKIRYGFLIFAVLTFYAAILLFLRRSWKTLKLPETMILIPLILAFPILLWDNIDSFLFTEKIRSWIDSGKNPNTFFTEYILNNVIWYATGRILLYISIIWFAAILIHHSFIKKWKGIAIGIFGIIGVIFCLLFLSGKPELYFPFMIPAIVMAPAYWLGLSLLNEYPKR